MFIAGIIVGCFISLIAVITGKKFERPINEPKYTVSPIINSIFQKKAEIIKKEDSIEEFLNG